MGYPLHRVHDHPWGMCASNLQPAQHNLSEVLSMSRTVPPTQNGFLPCSVYCNSHGTTCIAIWSLLVIWVHAYSSRKEDQECLQIFQRLCQQDYQRPRYWGFLYGWEPNSVVDAILSVDVRVVRTARHHLNMAPVLEELDVEEMR